MELGRADGQEILPPITGPVLRRLNHVAHRDDLSHAGRPITWKIANELVECLALDRSDQGAGRGELEMLDFEGLASLSEM